MRSPLPKALSEMVILTVDDEEPYLEMMGLLLNAVGFNNVKGASSGEAALELMESEGVDMVISDVHMPGLSGVELLRKIKGHEILNEIPVIMLSGVEQLDTVIECIDNGAEDYLHKPIKEALLWARVRSTLERKFLRDQERRLFQQVQNEKRKSEELLYNLIPETIAERIKKGEKNIAEVFSECTVLFADIVGFTDLSTQLEPSELVHIINTLFHVFDRLVEEYQLEKIKTNGDNYIVVGGLPPNTENHASRCAEFALRALDEIQAYSKHRKMALDMRVGLNTGAVVAGVVGRTRFSFDLWGETVNLASRMETLGAPNRVHLTCATRAHLNGSYHFEPRGEIEVKGKGAMETFFLRRH